MQTKNFSIVSAAVLMILTVTLLVTGTNAAAQQETVLHSFGNGKDGHRLYGNLIFDASGNLYGTTALGGAYSKGTVFELIPKTGGGWTEKVLHSFGNGEDGSGPSVGVIFDGSGNLYGTTAIGGAYSKGTVFELIPKTGGGWTEKVLHSFGNGTDGNGPYSSLMLDAGRLYGTTYDGGVYSYGTVFELSPKVGGGWTEKVLHSFNATGTDGGYPMASMIFDAGGNLYGTTVSGGTHDCGTVFELSPKKGGGWTETVVHAFNNNGTDGSKPYAGVILNAGNLYGTTIGGGTHYYGTVFELSPKVGGGWTETVLYSFGDNGTDGNSPVDAVTFYAGNIYGTTFTGGNNLSCTGNGGGCGTVFELTPAFGGGWTETVLYNFSKPDGFEPESRVIFDGSGNLYGTTAAGGAYKTGTVFEITP
jgi:uncharacterized repeat protein (TIGR03803 family)